MPVVPVHDPVLSDEDEDEEYEDTPSGDEEVFLPDEDQNEIEEVQSEDIPAYFSERDGMLFHSSASAPYPLPVDGHEQRVCKTSISTNQRIYVLLRSFNVETKHDA